MEFITLIVLVGVLLLLALLLLKHTPKSQRDEQAAMQMMQQQIESLRADMRTGLHHITENVNHRLQSMTEQMQLQTSSVGNRLDTAAKIIGDVQRNLGELGKATQEIKELGQGVSKLEELLRAPKLRGGLGELLLEELLKQVLPTGQYEIQYRFKNGNAVDAVIRTSDRMICIDSKFPLENFRKYHHAQTAQEQKPFKRAFVADVKKHIDAIAGKYILPDEGTYPFALMYIPAENIYYETIIKDGMSDDGDLYEYAIRKNVIPVSPNSFYAYVQVIALGLRGLSIEKSAQQIVDALAHLHGDMSAIRQTLDTLGTHLNNARNKYEEADKRLTTFEQRLEGIAGQTMTEDAPQKKLHLLQ